MGKVTRFISESSDETLNLLRKTTLGRLQAPLLEQLTSGFGELEEAGVVLPEVRTVVEPPLVQILPIAVFA